MSSTPRVPRRYRGTDLATAFLDGHADGLKRDMRHVLDIHPNYSRPEIDAYAEGFKAAYQLPQGGGA